MEKVEKEYNVLNVFEDETRSIWIKKDGPDWFTLYVWKVDRTKPNCEVIDGSYHFNSEIEQEITFSKKELLDKLGVIV
jgi:hypothetical protein